MIANRLIGLFLFLPFLIQAQEMPSNLDVKLGLLNYGENSIPSSLTSGRTAVIIQDNQANDTEYWKLAANEFHKGFKQIGIDAVLYINSSDFHANGPVTTGFYNLLGQRKIKHTIFIKLSNEERQLIVAQNDASGKIDYSKQAWIAKGQNTANLLFTLGLDVKQAKIASTNFLISSKPEFLEDMGIFSGSRIGNYPGAIMRQKVGVAKFRTLPIPEGINNEQKEIITKYNAQVVAKNIQLEQLFEGFEADWELIDYTSKEDALKERIQFVVFLVGTRGVNIRKMLNYPSGTNETHFISVTPGVVEGDVSLKRLRAESFMHKVYIFQTRANDIYVGREWDADEKWEDALANFFFTLKRQFE